MPDSTEHQPTIGGGVLLSNGINGWEPGALLFTTPLVLLRFSKGMTRLYATGREEPFHQSEGEPLALLEEVLAAMKKHLPAAGPKAGKPAFPVALVAASYEFGRWFPPHEECFPYADDLEEDEFFAAVFIDAFRPDSREGTERVGYAGTIPEGWMEGAPELQTTSYGHDAPPIVPHRLEEKVEGADLETAMGYEEYAARIHRIGEYLMAGDIYQANMTLPLYGRTEARPETVFDAALSAGGASFAMTLMTPSATVLSFSPELFLRRRGEEIETRPIKGTEPIGGRMGGVQEAMELLGNREKDRAEHLMIVDLERNDLGRICRPGTVEAEPLMQIVEHPTVVHMESTVKGKLKTGVRLYDIFAATFPGGSVTGAPKKRAMEILSELETGPRGHYCGALGWIDSDGDCDLNLPIRTALFRPDGRVEYRAGGGIVADSTAKHEWEEIETKAAFFRNALARATSGRGESGG